jgi:hypothetical protein
MKNFTNQKNELNTIEIKCIDKISLTFDKNYNSVCFTIPKKYKYNKDKIKEYSINKINQCYNLQYPYYFMKISDIIKSIDCSTKIMNDKMDVDIFIKDNIIYKLKFIGLCERSVFCVVLDNYTFRNVIEIMCSKYPLCYSAIFLYNNNKIDINVPIKIFNFKNNICNEIFCEKSDCINFDCSI